MFEALGTYVYFQIIFMGEIEKGRKNLNYLLFFLPVTITNGTPLFAK